MAVIGDMLGVLPQDREMFLKWSDDMVTFLSSTSAEEGIPGLHRWSFSPPTPST